MVDRRLLARLATLAGLLAVGSTALGCKTVFPAEEDYDCPITGCGDAAALAGDATPVDAAGDATPTGAVPGSDATVADVAKPDAAVQDAGMLDAGTTDTGAPASCNLVTWSGCSGSAGCFLDASNKKVCAPHGTLGFGETCKQLNDCKDGLICAEKAAGKSPVCLQICATTSTSTCPPGTSCLALLGSDQKPWADAAGVCK